MYRKRSLEGILVLLALLGLLVVGPADRAAAGELEETSIRLIPADAAFYSSMLRAGEQIEIIAKSNAWKKIMEMPSVKMGLGMIEEKLQDESDPQAAQAKAMLENPQIKNGLALLGDMFSNDVFMYGNADVADALELAQDLSNATSYAPIYYMATGEGDAMRPEEMQGRAALYVLAEDVDRIKVPTMVMGFAIEKEDSARDYLGMLKGMLGLVPLMVPDFPGKIDSEPVGDDDFLTITLKGESIPWGEVPLDDIREFEANDDGQINVTMQQHIGGQDQLGADNNPILQAYIIHEVSTSDDDPNVLTGSKLKFGQVAVTPPTEKMLRIRNTAC